MRVKWADVVVIVAAIMLMLLWLKVLKIIPGTEESIYSVGSASTLALLLAGFYYKIVNKFTIAIHREIMPLKEKIAKIESRCEERQKMHSRS